MTSSKLPLKDHVALVTGASGGIGGAIAASLSSLGVSVYAVGRNTAKLDALRTLAGAAILPRRADLTRDDEVATLVDEIKRAGRLDVLVHSAGSIAYGKIQESSVEQFDHLYVANVRAPFLLTQSLLPILAQSQGQVVFVNSSTGITARAGVAQFSATQHALKAIADALRDEVNDEGIRVISIFPGRTATPRMAERFSQEGREYRPEVLLQAEDIASVVANSLLLPRTAEVTDVRVRPLLKSY